MLSSVYKWRLFFITSHPLFAVNNKQYNTILIFRLTLALSMHGLKMPVLANTLFGP